MGVPDMHIQTFPMFSPTGDYPNISFSDLKLRGLNRFTHIASGKLAWWSSRYGYEQVRRRVGLPKRKLHFPFDEEPLRPMPRFCVRGVRAFCHPQAIGSQISM